MSYKDAHQVKTEKVFPSNNNSCKNFSTYLETGMPSNVLGNLCTALIAVLQQYQFETDYLKFNRLMHDTSLFMVWTRRRNTNKKKN